MHLKADRLKALFLALLSALLLCAGSAWAQVKNNPRVRIQTNMGAFVIEVYPQAAPKTVDNFLQYVKDKHYDGLVFHRVIDNFMVQGGGYDAKYGQRTTRAAIAHEGREALAGGGPRNVVGTVAMARTSDPHSASSQFFINVRDNAFLDATIIPPGDPVKTIEYMGKVQEVNAPRESLINHPKLWGYTVFGKIVSGMDVVNKIKLVPTGAGGPFPSDVPQTPIIIQSATIEK
jgi:peptidyl-prolyl cis-trans isomerase A (cyclophilin A)